MVSMLRVTAGESMIPGPCFRILQTPLIYCMFISCNIYFSSQLLFTTIYTTCILLSLRRTSAPIHLTSVLGVLGTQETSCILIAELLERDIFDLFLPEFDKPWVIHLRETCCCSTNLCTWRPNTVYKNRSVRRHQRPTVILRFPRRRLQLPGRRHRQPPARWQPRSRLRRQPQGRTRLHPRAHLQPRRRSRRYRNSPRSPPSF